MIYPIFLKVGIGLNAQTIHPSVFYEQNSWMGHNFWLVETPVPPFKCRPYRDRYELPYLFYSDDGLSWLPQSKRPIDDISEEQIMDRAYLSDPHLILVDNHIECYYRLCEHNDTHTVIYRKKSQDGINWSDREIVADNTNIEIFGNEIISPAVLCIENKYQMYYVDEMPQSNCRGIRVVYSDDGANWTKSVKCMLQYPTASVPSTKHPWHIDVKYFNSKYYLLSYDFENELTYWISDNGIIFKFCSVLLRPSHKSMSFYKKGLYRSSMVWKDGKMYVYFSAMTDYNSCIGVFCVDEVGNVSIIDGCKGFEKLWHATRMLIRPLNKIFRYIGKRLKIF